MFRLTRQVRFAVNRDAPAADAGEIENAYAGWPALAGAGQFFSLDVTVAGDLDPRSNYLLNIRDIDEQVRRRGIPIVEQFVRGEPAQFGAAMLRELLTELRNAWNPATLESLLLRLTPFESVSILAREVPMTRLSQKFEFAASHRLHNPGLSDEENQHIFGKCNNPHGHGHNYELQVTITGDGDGMVMGLSRFERIVRQTVIERFDHRNLNVELQEFKSTIPSVENIARIIHGLLKPQFSQAGVRLASVTVWETPKTWCEYGD